MWRAFTWAVVRVGRVTSKRARTEVASGLATIAAAIAVMSRLRPMRDDTMRTVEPETRNPASRAGCSRLA